MPLLGAQALFSCGEPREVVDPLRALSNQKAVGPLAACLPLSISLPCFPTLGFSFRCSPRFCSVFSRLIISAPPLSHRYFAPAALATPEHPQRSTPSILCTMGGGATPWDLAGSQMHGSGVENQRLPRDQGRVVYWVSLVVHFASLRWQRP